MTLNLNKIYNTNEKNIIKSKRIKIVYFCCLLAYMFSRVLCRSGSLLSRSSLPRTALCVQKRNLNIHEYQSQEIMRKYNISVANGAAASTLEDAKQVIQKIAASGLYLSFVINFIVFILFYRC